MKTWAVIRKSCIEHYRDFWILAITIFSAPFFVCVEYMIYQSEAVQLKAWVVNQDQGFQGMNHGERLIANILRESAAGKSGVLKIERLESPRAVQTQLTKFEGHAGLILPKDFSVVLAAGKNSRKKATIEFIGDVTNWKYMLTGIWLEDMVNQYLKQDLDYSWPLEIHETTLGHSGQKSEFDLYVPGLLILSIVFMIMTAASAMVREAEHRTLERIRLSSITPWQYLLGLSLVQVAVGILSLLLTLFIAMSLGFKLEGSFSAVALITVLTCVSMIGFSTLIAAFTRSIQDVMVIGTIPFFLLMFFTGAVFPINAQPLFTIAGHPIAWNSFLSPTLAVNAINQVLIMGATTIEIWFELVGLVGLSVVYFMIGSYAFYQRHMRLR